MNDQAKVELAQRGFTVVPNVFSTSQLDGLAEAINVVSAHSPNIRQSADVFAIRNLLQEVPSLPKLLWQRPFNILLDKLIGHYYHGVKGIYFDKLAGSNWTVPWHQDLQISVDRQENVYGWTNWTNRHGQWSVQPSAYYLNQLYTVRIHLDDCNETNGALKVLVGSHQQGILTDPDIQALDKTKAVTCNVPKGGLLVMRPLLVHASSKSTSFANRRVIHLELAQNRLPKGLQWREFSQRWTKLDAADYHLSQLTLEQRERLGLFPKS
ncbi:phytanoyl-CoA dioxygenase family protein [Fibrella aquatilis]|uniref:Phytanoyl-CoA dioxygenase family protein n=1 Tax=Fibrella aquatilis TaxID=2817059 RepID=A0A939G839_9BACT|nr:phytanoyl-CoA dioxygenase family protein [Fibrella aquatilis]MBO0933949.1 phytanoyl-CoA dioxygenase family protein [Fibrella aquatilis]